MSTVRVTRPRHPFEGRPLDVLGSMRRHGEVELLVVLPDGSKRLIPAAWTDLEDPADGGGGDGGPSTLGPVRDLLQLAALVSALSVWNRDDPEQAARQSSCEEDTRAACAAQSDPGPGTGATACLISQFPNPQVEAAVTLLACLIAKAAAVAGGEPGDE